METILRYGTDEQKERWLKPLLTGEIRSAFVVTEPDRASSDAPISRVRSRQTARTTEMVCDQRDAFALRYDLHGRGESRARGSPSGSLDDHRAAKYPRRPSVTLERIAQSRALIERARLLTLKAAWMVGNKAARQEIGLIKIVAPSMAHQVIQMFGGGGTSSDHLLTVAFAAACALRLVDGPDEVHRKQIAQVEIRRHQERDPAHTGGWADLLSISEAERLGSEGLWPKPKDFPA